VQKCYSYLIYSSDPIFILLLLVLLLAIQNQNYIKVRGPITIWT
jgi:uncharacterized integral membrane protein